jgi:hypothetical protein
MGRTDFRRTKGFRERIFLRFFVLLPPDWRIRQQHSQLWFHIEDFFWFISAAQLIARRELIVSLFLLGYVWCLHLFYAFFCRQGRISHPAI